MKNITDILVGILHSSCKLCSTFSTLPTNHKGRGSGKNQARDCERKTSDKVVNATTEIAYVNVDSFDKICLCQRI